MPQDPTPLLKALADPGRLLLARLLAEGTFNVSELCDIAGMPQSTASRNLKILAAADLITARREGRLIFYAWATALDPARAALRTWVQTHGPALEGDLPRRIHEVWDGRRSRTEAFFATANDVDSAAWLGSADCLPTLLEHIGATVSVLDLGTGTGRLLPQLRTRTAGQVIAVDGSPAMLEQARERLDASGVLDVDLRLGDLSHLPLQDGEVDTVIANMVLHHLPEPARALPEIIRVLRPGGRLLIGDFLPHDQDWMRESLADQWLGLSPEDVTHWLGDAGFEAVAVESIAPNRSGALATFVASAVRPPPPGA